MKQLVTRDQHGTICTVREETLPTLNDMLLRVCGAILLLAAALAVLI
ncbi:hypothetical protein [Paenibacillus sp. FSL R10-2771]